MKAALYLSNLALIVVLSACDSEKAKTAVVVKKRAIKKAQVETVETITPSSASADLKTISKSMVDDMIKVVGDEGVFKSGKPALAIRRFKNSTSEYVDMKGIQDSVRSALLRSGKFRFTTETPKAGLEEAELEEGSGLLKDAGKKANWIPPQFLVSGRLTSIKKEGGGESYLLLTLKLANVETAEIVYMAEKEVRSEAFK